MLFHDQSFMPHFVPHQKAWERAPCCCCKGRRRGICSWWNGLGRIDLHMISTMMSHATSMTHILRTMPCKCSYTHQHAHHVILLSKATSVQVITEADLCNKELFINVHFIFSKHFSSVKMAKLYSCLFCPLKLQWEKNSKTKMFLEQGRIRAGECDSYFRRCKMDVKE